MRDALHLLLCCLISGSTLVHGQLQQTSSMINRIDRLKTIIAGDSADTLRMVAYRELASDLARSDSTSAMLYIKDGIKLADRLADEESRLWLHYYRGLLFSHHNHFDQAIDHFLELSETLNHKDYHALAYKVMIELGDCYLETEDFDTALPHFIQCVKLFESLDDKSKADPPYQKLGALFFFQRDYKQAIYYTRKSIPLYEALNDTENLADSYNNLGVLYASQGNHKNALKYYKLNLELADKNDSANTLHNIGGTYFRLADYDRAIQAQRESHRIHRELGDDREASKNLLEIGFVHLEVDRLDSASYYFDQSIDFFTMSKDTNDLVNLFYEMGDKYAEKGNIPLSLSLYYDALALSEQQNNAFNIGNIYNSIAAVHRGQEDITTAIEFKRKAIEKFVMIKDTSRLAGAKNGMADLLIDTENYPEALKQSRQSLSLYQVYQDSCMLSHCYLTIGKAFANLNNIDSAQHYLREAFPQALKCGFTDVVTESHIQLGNIYNRLNQNDNAQVAFEKALSYAQQLDNKTFIKKATSELYPLYQKQNQYKKAFETLDLFQASKDSLFNQENTRILVQKEMEHSFEKEQQHIEMEQQKILNRQKGFTQIFILGCLFLLAIALSIYRNYRNKQRANDLLSEQNVEIIKQKAELEQLDKMKSRFFANISHELRTPLTLISSPIQQLIKTEKDNLNASALQELQLMGRNAKQLKGLVNDIMDLSKLESNKIELHKQVVAAVPFLRRTTSNFDSLATHLGIQYDTQIDVAEDVHLLLDAGKLEKIINNLLSNAIKHTSSSGTVHLVAQKAGANLKIQVIDTGQGIAQEDLPHIFDRYFQSKRSDAVLQGGTGVGLAMAKELTSLMGGTLSAESQLGEGSTFTLLLPYHLVTEPKLAVIGLEEDEEEISLVHLHTNAGAVATKKFNVLIVEDHQDMQKFIQRLLDNKYNTHVANHGIQALQLLEKESIDLIVSDVMMPEMDGYSLLKELKEHATFKQIPVVMLTALDSEDNKLKALTLGVDDYLSKPFSPEELLARAHNLLQRYEVRQQVQQELELETLEEADQKPINKFQVERSESDLASTKHSEIDQLYTKQKDTAWLNKVEQIMRKEIENPDFNLTEIAGKLFLSQRQFQRKMKQMTGLTPKKFQIEVALQMGRDLLEKKAYGSVKAIAYSVGMTNVWRFSQLYEARFGKKPSDYF